MAVSEPCIFCGSKRTVNYRREIFEDKIEMITLSRDDLKWCLRRLPKDVLELMEKEGDYVVLAGGYIRARITGEKPSDIDMFTKTSDAAELYARRLSFKEPIETDNAFTVTGRKLSVQFIKKWTYDKPMDVIQSFDFTIARAAIWFDTVSKEWQSLCDDRYYIDLAARRLVYCSPKRIEEVGGSMLRVLKFYQRGYRIPLDSLGGVIARVITGIDFERGGAQSEDDWKHIITGLLREVDPQTDPTHVAHLPAQEDDKI